MKLHLFIILFILSLKSYATHIVGGELFYECLGNNDYRITLKLYRDCINGQAAYDNPASLGIFDSNNNWIQTVSLPFPGSTILPATLINHCFIPPTNICVEEAIYTQIVNLPNIPGGYTISYQRCCRNNTILNIINSGNVGSTYTIQIPDLSLATCNNSPSFKNFPPIFLCSGVPLTFDHSATDLDGDSLVYELCDPYEGATSLNPQPVPPAAPPYSFVPWDPPYSGTNPISAAPVLSINQNTGLLTGTPNLIGQWVVGICVKEYRNGFLLSTNKRDFQFNVVSCPMIPVSSVPSQQTFCFGYTVNFLNNSVNANTFFWDFNDPLSNNDTSSLATPTWTYSNSGTYTIMLIASPGDTCADTSYTTFDIAPLLQPSFVPPPGQCLQDNSFNFIAGGNFNGNGSFTWSFGSHATPDSSSLQNPVNIIFDTLGAHLITLTVSENGCTESYSDSIMIYPPPEAGFSAYPQSGCDPLLVQFIDSSSAGTPISYSWNFGDGNTSTAQNPTHLFTQSGFFDVTLTIMTTTGCIDTITLINPQLIEVLASPEAYFEINPNSPVLVENLINITDLSIDAINCYLYFGDGNYSTNCDTSYKYSSVGNFIIQQIVTNILGCTDTFEINIRIDPDFYFWVPNAFTPDNNQTNDIFIPSLKGVELYSFQIYNKWGELIFETDKTEVGWNGIPKNSTKIAQEDVYIYRISFKDIMFNEMHTYFGRLTLLK